MVSTAGPMTRYLRNADPPGRLGTRLHWCRPRKRDRPIRILRVPSPSLHHRCDRLHDLPYRRGMSPSDATPDAYTQIVVILVLRLAFVIPNKLRDKKFAEGDLRYDPNVITYEDMTDKQNLHFRYLSMCPLPYRLPLLMISVKENRTSVVYVSEEESRCYIKVSKVNDVYDLRVDCSRITSYRIYISPPTLPS
jgi:hypothetical protein